MSAERASRPSSTSERDLALELRRVLGRFATGVTVVTTCQDGHAQGMTANAFTSVSLKPPLVLISVDKRAATCQRIQDSRSFAINILSDAQEHLARRFAGPHRDMADPFSDLRYRLGPSGSPLLEGVTAWIDCTLYRTYEGGDHLLFLGQILDFGLDPDRAPLLFYVGGFHSLPAKPLEEDAWTWFWAWY